MAENKQDTETKNSAATGGGKTTDGSGSAASTKQAKTETSTSKSGDANTAKETFDAVKESAGNIAGQAVDQVKEKAGSVLDEQKTNLAYGITSVADSIRNVGENLGGSGENNQIAALAGKYGDTLAGQIEKFSGYIDDKEITELVSDVEKFARRNPLLFVGGAFALGLLAARFLKSSGGGRTAQSRSQNNRRNA